MPRLVLRKHKYTRKEQTPHGTKYYYGDDQIRQRRVLEQHAHDAGFDHLDHALNAIHHDPGDHRLQKLPNHVRNQLAKHPPQTLDRSDPAVAAWHAELGTPDHVHERPPVRGYHDDEDEHHESAHHQHALALSMAGHKYVRKVERPGKSARYIYKESARRLRQHPDSIERHDALAAKLGTLKTKAQDRRSTRAPAPAPKPAPKATATPAPTAPVAASVERSPGLVAALDEHERKICRASIEHAFAFTLDGGLVLAKSGTRSYVEFSDAETAQMRGGVLTHNHPSGGAFSPEDIVMLCVERLSEIRAVGKDYRYSARPIDPAKVPGSVRIHSAYQDAKASMFDEYRDAVIAGTMTADQAWMEHSNRMWEQIAPKLGLIYERTAWEKE